MANLLDRLQTLLFGAAIGRASSEAINPVLEPVRQHAWFKNQNKVLDPATAAELVAKRFITESEGLFDSTRNGVAASRFSALIHLAQTYPGLADLAKLSNRDLLDHAQVREVFARHSIPDTYIGPLMALFHDLLTPGELAAAIHRGLVPDAGLVLGEQPEPPFKVDAYPVQPIDPIKEAEGSGYDRERLHVLVGLQGLPMGPHEAAQALFRGVITRGDYIRAFNTSNMRNEWAQAILDQSRQIPTARDFLENALRGYSNLDEAIRGAARHGMSEADATLIYQNQGRPMNIHQITQALARGAKFHPEPGELTDPYKASIVEGPVKPAYYEMAESLKYTLPGVFAMRALAESGVWDEAKTAERLKWAGWYPPDADEVAKAWTTTTTAVKVDPWITKAETHLWTATHKAYVKNNAPQAAADTALAHFIETPATRAAVFALWDAEKTIDTTPPAPAP